MLREFRDFVARGNVLDLAVAVIIGAAFATITTSLTEDVIMPVVGAIFGGLDFSSYFVLLGPVPEGYQGSLTDYAGAQGRGRAGARLGPVRHRPDQLPDPRLHHLPADPGGEPDDGEEGGGAGGAPSRPRSCCCGRSGTSCKADASLSILSRRRTCP